MMHEPGGKRIRMDESVPEEQISAAPPNDIFALEHQEPAAVETPHNLLQMEVDQIKIPVSQSCLTSPSSLPAIAQRQFLRAADTEFAMLCNKPKTTETLSNDIFALEHQESVAAETPHDLLQMEVDQIKIPMSQSCSTSPSNLPAITQQQFLRAADTEFAMLCNKPKATETLSNDIFTLEHQESAAAETPHYLPEMEVDQIKIPVSQSHSTSPSSLSAIRQQQFLHATGTEIAMLRDKPKTTETPLNDIFALEHQEPAAADTEIKMLCNKPKTTETPSNDIFALEHQESAAVEYKIKILVSQSCSTSPSSLPAIAQQQSEIAMLHDKPMTPETPRTQLARYSAVERQSASVHTVARQEAHASPVTPNRGRSIRGRGGHTGHKGKRLRRQSLTFMSQDIYHDEAGLYNALTENSASLPDVINRWIELYKIDRDNALLLLIQFFLSSSGCKGRVTSEMQATMEFNAIIRTMTQEFDEESAVYPLIAAGKRWNKFRMNYGKFVQTLVHQCQYSIIYDRYLMDRVISVLTEMSDSQVRAFRHTATFAAMKLITALVNVASKVMTNLRVVRRQYEAEQAKSRENRAMARLENLAAKKCELEENTQEIKEMLEYMLKSIFVHRYTDVVADIRASCIAEMGLWMLKFHEYFLDDSYLKYIGWLLHDKVGDVRLKSLEALQPLYACENFTAKLDLFTRKFKDRIVCMTLDKEPEVAVQAVKLVTSILKHHRNILTDENCEDIYEIVYSTHREVAHAAGEFLNARLFATDGEAKVGTKTRRGKRRLSGTPGIRNLVLFFIEAEVHEHAAYLVDSLIESNTMMKDWECMTDLLIEEAGPEEETLNNQQETSLIEIMVCCAKQVATGESPIDRGPARKIVTAKRQKQVEDDRKKLTEHFIPKLPELLGKYRADPEKTSNLLAVPQYFDLEIYTTMRRESDLDALLEVMHAIVEKTHDSEVLTTAAKTLEVLCVGVQGVSQRCAVARAVLLDRIVEKYKEATDKYASLIEDNQSPDADEIFDVVHWLKKVSIYYSLHDMNSYEIWDSLYKNLEEAGISSERLPDEAIVFCIRACYFSILWSQNSLLDADSSGARLDIETRLLIERLHSFLDSMIRLLGLDENASHVSSSPILREEAYVSICDCLVFFNGTTTDDANPVLAQLAYRPDDRVQTTLNRFVQENVFSGKIDDKRDVEGEVERLHTLRNFLAGWCKVVVHTTIPMRAAADVFKHYVKYYNDYGDIIKTTIGKTRDNNRIHCARTMQRSLSILYNDMVEARGEVNRYSEEFAAVKELAKRFALSFGFDAVKNSGALIALHGDGILFAITPPGGAEHNPATPPANLPFLEILAEFSYKLVDTDKRTVLNFIDKKLHAGLLFSQRDEWKPLLLYRNSLMHGAADQVSVTSKRANAHRKKDRAAVEENTDDAVNEFTPEDTDKLKDNATSEKIPLPVTNFTRPRGPGTPCLDENSDAASITVSPMPTIEDSSLNAGDCIDDGPKPLQIQLSTHTTSMDLFQEPME